MHGDRDADSGVRARELLEHEHVCEEARAGATVLLRHAHPHQAELAEPCDHLERKAVLAIPLAGMRRDLGIRDLSRERLDLSLLGG